MKLNRKNKMLLLGLAVALYLCYAFAFSNTLDYYRQYKSQKEIAANNFNDPEILQKLIAKDRQLNSMLLQYSINTDASFQNELLKQLSILSNNYNLKITDFKEPHTFTNDGIKVSSYIFSAEGGFNGILLLINSIENKLALGSIKHINFLKKKNYKTNTDYLVAEVVLQKSETINNK